MVIESRHGPVVVELPTPADAAALLALHRRILAEGEYFITEAGELREDVAAKIDLIRSMARTLNSHLLVARVGPQLAGMASASGGTLRRTRHLARVEMMVDAPYREAGVGSALLSALIAWGCENPEVTKLSLQVFAHNERAVGLYRKFGFLVEGRRRGEYRFSDGSFRDDLLMARSV